MTGRVRLSTLNTILVTILAMAIAALTGPLVSRWNVGIRELAILVLGLLIGILVIIPTERVLGWGLSVWVLTFAFGWRTIHVTQNLNVHPSEVFAWLLFFSLLGRSIIRRIKMDLSLPPLLLLFMLLALLGISTALARNAPPDKVIQEFKIFLVFIPCYYIVKWLIVSRANLDHVVRLSILVAVYISCLGLMDVLTPDLSRTLAGQDIDTVAVDAVVGFQRAGFVFYGNYTAGFVIFTFFGLSAVYFLNSLEAGGVKRIVGGLILLLELAGMYLSGFRGLFYAIGVFVIVYAVVERRAWVLLGALIAGLPFLPGEFFQRASSLVDLQYSDSSQFKRIDRATQAFDLMSRSPLSGVGWSGSGYVHSDFIQIGANLGAPALILFVLWILSMIWRLFGLGREQGWVGEYARALFATFCGLILVFSGEGLTMFVQLMLPVWFIFSLVYKLRDFASQEKQPITHLLQTNLAKPSWITRA
jgi:hypothetical protein